MTTTTAVSYTKILPGKINHNLVMIKTKVKILHKRQDSPNFWNLMLLKLVLKLYMLVIKVVG